MTKKIGGRRPAVAQGKRKSVAVTADTEPGYITTAIHIPQATHELLRRVAFRRALDGGGRVSVSALVVDLVEQHRKEFEREVMAI